MLSEPFNESKSSDDEFWNTLEKIKDNEPSMQSLQPKQKFSPLRSSEKEKYEKTITNIRESKEEEMRSLQIKVRNRTKKELFSSINLMKENFYKEAARLQETFASSRSIIKKKESEIADLTKIAIQQEAIISQMRVTHQKYKKPKQNLQETEENDLKHKYKACKLQLKALKEVCLEHKADAIMYKSQNEQLIHENNKLKQLYETTAAELANFSSTMCDKLLKEKQELQNNFEKFKIETEKELELRELLNNRHLNAIQSLQDELKTAKLVIKTPRIHYKAIEKLKYSLDSEDISKKPNISNRENILPESLHKNKTRIANNYSYKEYKSFNNEETKSGIIAPRTVSITPRLDLSYQKSSKIGYYQESKHKISKNSILYYNKTSDM